MLLTSKLNMRYSVDSNSFTTAHFVWYKYNATATKIMQSRKE